MKVLNMDTLIQQWKSVDQVTLFRFILSSLSLTRRTSMGFLLGQFDTLHTSNPLLLFWSYLTIRGANHSLILVHFLNVNKYHKSLEIPINICKYMLIHLMNLHTYRGFSSNSWPCWYIRAIWYECSSKLSVKLKKRPCAIVLN